MSDCHPYKYVKLKLKYPPFAGEIIQPKHSHNQSENNMAMLWV